MLKEKVERANGRRRTSGGGKSRGEKLTKETKETKRGEIDLEGDAKTGRLITGGKLKAAGGKGYI